MPQSNSSGFRVRPNCEALEDRLTPAVHVRFDYTFDTQHYFDSADRRAALNDVAAAVTAQIGDSLGAIAPSGGNTWQAKTWNSATNSHVVVNNLAVGADEIVIFITTGNLGSALGIASGAGYSASGSADWLNTVKSRGQAGALNGTDFSTWGGLIAFNSTTNFNFAGTPGRNQFDFRSVATHEMLHVFGFGLENPSYERYATSGAFTGPNLVATAGYAVALQPGENDHFAAGTRYAGQESVMTPSVTIGQVKRLTALEYAALRDIGWGATPAASAPSTPVAVVSAPVVPTPVAATRFVVGGGEGSVGTVAGYDANGQTVFSAAPFGTAFLGGIRVATGDVNGDGIGDVIAAAGPGAGPRVVVLSGATGQELASFFAFDAGFVNGIYVASADFNRDGYADIAVAAGFGAGPHVKVFSGRDYSELASFYTFDPGYVGGLDLAVGDINGDGAPDIVVGAMGGAVAVFNGTSVIPGRTPTRLLADFLAFDFGYNGRISVAVGDLDGDGIGDIIVGTGAGNAPRIAAYSGRDIYYGVQSTIASFYAGDPNSATGVRVAAADVDGDGRDDLIASPLGQSDGTVRIYTARVGFGGAPPASRTLQNSSWATYGTYVG